MAKPRKYDLDPTSLSASELDRLVGKFEDLDQYIAQHQEVAGSTLKKLARSRSRPVLRNVVLNPVSPKDVLVALAPKFPREFFANPVFPLLLLEEPDLFSKLPITVIKAILKSSDCPVSIMEWAMHHGGSSHALALAGKENVPISMLRQIAHGPHIKAAELATSRLMRMGEPICEQS